MTTRRVAVKKAPPANWRQIIMAVETRIAAGNSITKACREEGAREDQYWRYKGMQIEEQRPGPRAASNSIWAKTKRGGGPRR